MAALSNYLEAQLINAVLRGSDFTSPSVDNLHMALFTSDPTDDNETANEVSEDWYSRVPTGSWTSPSVNSDGKNETKNSSAITFDAVDDADSSHTITITHVGIYDASSSGNLLVHAPLTMEKTLEVGDVISFAENAMVITLD